MATAPNKPMLDMDDSKRPPEMALYLVNSPERRTSSGNQRWLEVPAPFRRTGPLQATAIPEHITDLLKESGTDALVPVLRIFDGLSQIPFGIREGLQPFILAIYLSTHHQRVALYEDGTYSPRWEGKCFFVDEGASVFSHSILRGRQRSSRRVLQGYLNCLRFTRGWPPGQPYRSRASVDHLYQSRSARIFKKNE